MQYKLEAEYEGTNLELKFDAQAKASLFINDVERDSVMSPQTSITLRLNSVLQTGYEYHEFIEATIVYSPEQIDASIRSGDTELGKTTIKRAG